MPLFDVQTLSPAHAFAWCFPLSNSNIRFCQQHLIFKWKTDNSLGWLHNLNLSRIFLDTPEVTFRFMRYHFVPISCWLVDGELEMLFFIRHSSFKFHLLHSFASLISIFLEIKNSELSNDKIDLVPGTGVLLHEKDQSESKGRWSVLW